MKNKRNFILFCSYVADPATFPDLCTGEVIFLWEQLFYSVIDKQIVPESEWLSC